MRLKTMFAAACWLVLAGAVAEAAPMTFKRLEFGCPKACVRVLLGEGQIVHNSARAFKTALRRAGPGTPVILHSPGGQLAGGLLLGVAFREAGINVGVAPGGACFSACAYALLGGVNRKVLSGGKVGVHEFFDIDGDPKRKLTAREKQENKEIVELLKVYTQAMGVSPELVSLALRRSATTSRFSAAGS
jgi:hypothetical protein